MNWERLGKLWMDKDSAKRLESELRESLKKLEAEGATNREIAERVIESPFILGLIWTVTSSGTSKRLKTSHGRPPEQWEEWLAHHDLRDDWRSETANLLKRKCEHEGLLGCKLEQAGIGGFWRMVVIDKAVKAAWALFRKNICKVRKGKTARDVSSVSDCDGIANLRDERLRQSLVDFQIDFEMATSCVSDVKRAAFKRLTLLGNDYQEVANFLAEDIHQDLMVLIREVQDAREREVMRLSLLGHSYANIERILTEANGPGGKKVTFDMVRYAHKKGVAALQERLGLAA